MSLILSGSNGLSDVDGTADTPAIRGTDTNTGIFFPAADVAAFSTNGLERMRITSGGNVGIGSASAYGQLTINQSGQSDGANASTFANILINQASATINSNGGLDFRGSAFQNGYGFRISAIDSSGVHLVFGNRQNTTTYTEVMRINASGNLGIGTNSPGARLDVAGTTYVRGDSTNGTFTSAGQLAIKRSNSSPFISFHANAGSRIGYLQYNSGAASNLVVEENQPFAIYTNSAERMRITSGGDLLVNSTSTSYSVSGNSFRWVNGVALLCSKNTTADTNQVVFFNPNGQVGFINTGGTITSYGTSSDYRLKENIAPMTGALAKVSALKPVTYKWKADGSDGQGFIAHELQEVVPDCVTGEKDAVNEDGSIKAQGIDTSFLVATLTAAIQELKATVDAQAARIAALESK
jgi:hypothetical protein